MVWSLHPHVFQPVPVEKWARQRVWVMEVHYVISFGRERERLYLLLVLHHLFLLQLPAEKRGHVAFFKLQLLCNLLYFILLFGGGVEEGRELESKRLRERQHLKVEASKWERVETYSCQNLVFLVFRLEHLNLLSSESCHLYRKSFSLLSEKMKVWLFALTGPLAAQWPAEKKESERARERVEAKGFVSSCSCPANDREGKGSEKF